MATRKAPEPKDLTNLIVAGSILVAILATVLGAPGVAVVWLGLVIAGWMIPRPVFTGKKNAYGQATPAHPGESAAQLRHRLWSDLRWRLIVPQAGWLPGLPVNLSWVHAVAIALAVTAIPQSVPYGPLINAVAAFIIVAQVQWTRRQFASEQDKNPGVPVSALGGLWTSSTSGKVFLVAGVVLGAAAGVTGVVTGYLNPLIGAWVGVAVMIAVWLKPVSDVALVGWRALVKARAEWDYRWGQFKLKDTPPRLLSTRQVGPARVDEFDAQLSGGSSAFTVKNMSDTARTVLGANMKVAMVDVEDVDSQGQPKPGTIHASRFKVIQWPDDQFPDLNDPTLDPELATLAISSAAAWACDAVGYSRFNPATVELITQAPVATTEDEEDEEDGETPKGQEADEEFFAIWKTTWTNRTGLSIGEVRNRADIRGEMEDQFGTSVLVDQRAKPSFMLIGAVYDDTNTLASNSGVTQKSIDDLIEEDQWRVRWGAVLKQNVNAPKPSFPNKETRRLNGRQSHMSLTRLPFTTLQGEDPKQYFGLESQLAATLSAAPFVAINGFRQSKTDRSPGSRHPQAFNLTWSADAIPTDLSNLAGPERRGQLDGTEWVIAGRMNEAFRASRLAIPEVMKVEALTKSTSRKHIWKVKLRLYDGVTIQNVRTAVGKFLSVSGSPWARVSEDGEGCTVYIGAKPPVQGSARADVVLENPGRDIPLLTALDWEQAWNVSGVRGTEGALPKLVLTSHLEHNDKVQVLDFSLPPGVEMSDVKAAVGKLKSATGNAFIDVRVSPDGASSVRLLVCEVNPMPERAGYDFTAIDDSAFLPFATGIDGEPIAYKPKVDPHILIAGASGGGKSVVLQSLIYSALIRGWDMYITDPTKSAADFQFASPYAKSITVDIFEAAAMMRTVYAEVLRRKKLNAANGVGNYRDLPEDIRPPHIGIVIDEFTSLMGADPVPKPSDDPEMEAEREAILAVNAAKQQIGVYTGKIAREARSTGATLFLATQKLSAKMLDTIPGAGDLKDLSLDTILPVPVSDRFPSGWARNDQLEIGDTLYTPSGDETTILAFSDVFTDNDVYEVTFDDGQVITAGADHLWKVSDESSRGQVRSSGSDSGMLMAAACSMPTSALASARDLSGITGMTTTRVSELATSMGLDRFTDDGQVLDRGSRHGLVNASEFLHSLAVHVETGSAEPVEKVASTIELSLMQGAAVQSGFVAGRSTSTGLRYITSVTKVESVPTRCIAVDDPEHLFLVEGFIPTHNTNLSRMLLGKATFGEKQSALRAATEAPELGDVVPPGRGLWETTEGAAMIMQSWYDPAEQKRLATELEERLTPLDEGEKADISKYMPKPVSQPGVFDADGDQDDVAPVPTVVDESDDVVLDDLELSLDDLEADPISLALAALNAGDDATESDDGEELVWDEDEVETTTSSPDAGDELVWDEDEAPDDERPEDAQTTAESGAESPVVVPDDEPATVDHEPVSDLLEQDEDDTAEDDDPSAPDDETPVTRIVVATHESLVNPEPGTLYLWEGTVAAPAGSTSIVGTGAEGDTGWDVLDALMVEVVMAGPDVSEVVWYDTGSLSMNDPDFGVSRREIVAEALSEMGISLTLAQRPRAELIDAW